MDEPAASPSRPSVRFTALDVASDDHHTAHTM